MNDVFARAFTPKPKNRLARSTSSPANCGPRPARFSIWGGRISSSAPRGGEGTPPRRRSSWRQSPRRRARPFTPEDTTRRRRGRGRTQGGPDPLAGAAFGRHEVRFSSAGREPVTETVTLSRTAFQALGVTLPTVTVARAGELVAFGPGVVPERLGSASRLSSRRRRPRGQVVLELRIDGGGQIRGVSLRARRAPLSTGDAPGRGRVAIRPYRARGAGRVCLLVRHLFRR
jgi:hypothetical protein